MQKINKLNINPTLKQGVAEYEVIVKKGDEVVYQNKAYGGVFNFVESPVVVNTSDNTLMGKSQNFIFGHPAVILFSLDQLRQSVKKNLDENMATLIDFIQKKGGKFTPND